MPGLVLVIVEKVAEANENKGEPFGPPLAL